MLNEFLSGEMVSWPAVVLQLSSKLGMQWAAVLLTQRLEGCVVSLFSLPIHIGRIITLNLLAVVKFFKKT
jgi:hypothetical protein